MSIRRLETAIPVVLVLLLFAGAVPAQKQALRFSEESWNFGERLQGEKDAKIIKVTNSGARPVRVKNLGKTCGCVEPSLKEDVIPAGATVELLLELDTRRAQGEIRKFVILETDEADREKYNIAINGTIHTIWDLSTRSLNLGEARRGAGVVGKFRITIRKGHEIGIESIVSHTQLLDIVTRPFKDADGTHGFDVELGLKERIEPGYFEDIILVKTDDQVIPQRGLRVFGEILSNTKVSPRTLSFGVLTPGKEKTMSLQVESVDGSPVKVLEASCQDPMVSTEIEEKVPGKLWEIRVTVNPKAGEKDLRGQVLVRVEEMGEVSHYISFFGRILLP